LLKSCISILCIIFQELLDALSNENLLLDRL